MGVTVPTKSRTVEPAMWLMRIPSASAIPVATSGRAVDMSDCVSTPKMPIGVWTVRQADEDSSHCERCCLAGGGAQKQDPLSKSSSHIARGTEQSLRTWSLLPQRTQWPSTMRSQTLERRDLSLYLARNLAVSGEPLADGREVFLSRSRSAEPVSG